jgi:hypothetical protein
MAESLSKSEEEFRTQTAWLIIGWLRGGKIPAYDDAAVLWVVSVLQCETHSTELTLRIEIHLKFVDTERLGTCIGEGQWEAAVDYVEIVDKRLDLNLSIALFWMLQVQCAEILQWAVWRCCVVFSRLIGMHARRIITQNVAQSRHTNVRSKSGKDAASEFYNQKLSRFEHDFATDCRLIQTGIKNKDWKWVLV